MILAVHFFFVPAWVTQQDFPEVWGMRAICQRETSTLVSCTAMTRLETKSRRWRHLNLLYRGEKLLNYSRKCFWLRTSDLLTGTKAREIHGIRTVDLAIITNWSVWSSLLWSKHLGIFKVWIARVKLFPTGYVKQDLLQHCGGVSTLSSTLSTSELELFFAWTISANSTFKKLVVCNNL